MIPDKEKAPLRGEAIPVNFDLLGGEIKKQINSILVNRQHSHTALPKKIRGLFARLPLALDEETHPILAENWPLDTKRQILRMIRYEMVKLGVRYV